MQIKLIKPFGLDITVLIPENKEDFMSLTDVLSEQDELAIDTETVGIYSEKMFLEALDVEQALQKHQLMVDRVESVYRSRFKGKRTPEAKLVRDTRYKHLRVHNRLIRSCASLKKKAVDDPGGLHFWENKLGCFQIGYREYGRFVTMLVRPEYLGVEFLEMLLNTRKYILFHNGKFDWKMIKQHLGIALKCDNLFDTMIADYVLLNGTGKKLNLGVVAKRRLDFTLAKAKDLRVSNWTGPWSDDMIEYSALDVVIPFLLKDQQVIELKPTETDPHRLLEVFEDECKLVPYTAQMEMNGIGIDIKSIKALLGTKLKERDAAIDRCIKAFKLDINLPLSEVTTILNSSKRIKPYLEEVLGALPSTSKLALIKMESTHEEVSALLQYRRVNKIITTYLEPFIKKSVKLDDGSRRLYAEFKQTHTETQRYSCEDPNLQNMPSTAEFRNLIIPRPGHALISADLANIDPRILAHVTGDPVLKRIFREGLDPYKYMAALFLGVQYDDVTKEQRKRMKPLLLAAMYGKKEYSLSKDLECDINEAFSILNTFFNTFICVKRWVTNTLESARSSGYVETLTGLRRYLPNIHSEDKHAKSNAENASLNTQIQGLAARCMKNSVRLAITLSTMPDFNKCKLILTVHDELLLEVPDNLEWHEKGKVLLKTALIDGTKNIIDSVPIKVGSEPDFEPSVIYQWGEMKD